MPNSPPTRSRTDPPAPAPHQHEKSHLHRRLHSNSLRHRAFTSSKHHHSHSHGGKETVQSAVELKPPISLDQLLRREKRTPNSSRRGSGSGQQQHQTLQSSESSHEWSVQQTRLEAQWTVKPRDVQNAKKQNALREEELRRSVKGVEELAMSSTRQLDDTYYSVLEKASILRSTVASLCQLSEESRRMHAAFQEDTDKLEQDTKQNLATFGNFDAQEQTITRLVEQLKKAKDRRDVLNDRLEACRNRVEAYEQREDEKQKKRRQQWGLIWGVLAAFVILLIAVVVAKRRSTFGSNIHYTAKLLDELGSEIASPIAAALRPTASSSEDAYLKELFDEI